MLDDLLTNKYFCIAIILALLVVLYLYIQKRSCDVENMQNVDLTPLAQELVEHPWTNRPGGDNFRKYDGRFDRFADAYTKAKLKKNGYSYTDFLERDDQRFLEYENYQKLMPESERQRKGRMITDRFNDDVPMPLDTHPELSQCQPCICPDGKRGRRGQRRQRRMSDDLSDSDTDSEQRKNELIRRLKRTYKKQLDNNRKMNKNN